VAKEETEARKIGSEDGSFVSVDLSEESDSEYEDMMHPNEECKS
jgi:hypothetical protein